MLYPTSMLADALAERLRDGYREMFGSCEAHRAEFVATAAHLTLHVIGDSDALYHNVEHTALVTLVGQDILRGRLLYTHLQPGDWMHLTLAMLLHDVGYVRGVCPGDRPGHCVIDEAGTTVAMPRGASDAWLAPHHIERGKIAVRARLGRHPGIDVERLARAIERTRFPVPEDADHAGTEDEAGLVRAADLIGQLADPQYLRRAGALYHELAETGVAAKLGYANPADLIEKYPAFYWSRIEPYIGPALRCLRRTMAGKSWVAHLYANVFTVEHQLRTIGPEPLGAKRARPAGDAGS
ncbi:MAG: hypothetical protein U1E52_17405 [Geminicoccaceae bacterium]